MALVLVGSIRHAIPSPSSAWDAMLRGALLAVGALVVFGPTGRDASAGIDVPGTHLLAVTVAGALIVAAVTTLILPGHRLAVAAQILFLSAVEEVVFRCLLVRELVRTHVRDGGVAVVPVVMAVVLAQLVFALCHWDGGAAAVGRLSLLWMYGLMLWALRARLGLPVAIAVHAAFNIAVVAGSPLVDPLRSVLIASGALCFSMLLAGDGRQLLDYAGHPGVCGSRAVSSPKP